MSTAEAVRLYSVASVADRLEVSTDYVYDRISAGDLAVTELGHGRAKQRIRADVLQAFIDGRTFSLPLASVGEPSTTPPVVAPGRESQQWASRTTN